MGKTLVFQIFRFPIKFSALNEETIFWAGCLHWSDQVDVGHPTLAAPHSFRLGLVSLSSFPLGNSDFHSMLGSK